MITRLDRIIEQQIPSESTLILLRTEHIRYPDIIELDSGPTDLACIVRHQADLQDVTTDGATSEESVKTPNNIIQTLTSEGEYLAWPVPQRHQHWGQRPPRYVTHSQVLQEQERVGCG